MTKRTETAFQTCHQHIVTSNIHRQHLSPSNQSLSCGTFWALLIAKATIFFWQAFAQEMGPN